MAFSSKDHFFLHCILLERLNRGRCLKLDCEPECVFVCVRARAICSVARQDL